MKIAEITTPSLIDHLGRRVPIRYLYHCTRRENLPSILQHGLDPTRATDSGHTGRVKPFIYLSHDPGYASAYDRGEIGDSTWVLLRIDVRGLDQRLLGPDDDDLADILDQEDIQKSWTNYTWLESLRICSQCTYRGVIPPAVLRVMDTHRYGRG